MPRVLKQILYGLLYLGVLAIIVWAFIPRNVEVATCIDDVQNQNETEVDCGGPCEDCELKNLRLEVGGVDILEVGEKSSLLVKVENPSKNFGASEIPYKFEVKGTLGEPIELVEGELNIGSGEEKYIAAVGLDIKASNIGEVIFSLGDFAFIPKVDLLDYDIEIENVEVSFPEQVIQARGLIANDSGGGVSRVTLTALFYTKEGDLANVGTALLSNLEAFEKRDFLISVPSNGLFINPGQTEISWRII